MAGTWSSLVLGNKEEDQKSDLNDLIMDGPTGNDTQEGLRDGDVQATTNGERNGANGRCRSGKPENLVVDVR